jgi:outer membrane protein OmpA-like peptidoglycan-associated protein
MMHDGIAKAGLSPRPLKRSWLPRSGAVLLVFGLVGCSSLPDVPDYADPVEWYHSSTDMVGGWFNDEEPTIESAAGTKKKDGKFPSLSTVPAKPEVKLTSKERANLKNQLASDRANARYTDQKLSKTAAPKLAALITKSVKVPAAATRQAERAPAKAYSGQRSSLWPNAPAPTSSAQGATTSARVGRPAVSTDGQVAKLQATASGATSKAPKPDAMRSSIAAAPAVVAPAPAAPVAPPAPSIPPKFSLTPPSPTQTESMQVENTDSPVLQLKQPMPEVGNSSAGGQQPMLMFGNAGLDGAAEIITFRHGSARLSGADRSKIEGMAQQAMNAGSYIRVVGHASMRTRDMDPFEHTLANFNVSLKRANVVASALLEMGVPPERLIVDAVGDTQPLFSEAMPAGEEGNRRTEIFLEF